MRAGAASGRGGIAVAVPSGRPGRLAEIVGGLLGGQETVSFTPVDGVFRPEMGTEPDRDALVARRVQPAGEAAPTRLYDARARAVLVWQAPLGTRIDVRA